MKYIILDMEWNGAPLYAEGGGYFNEIIEIGAVRLDEEMTVIDTFQALIRPAVHKKLTGRVKRLTHISNSEVRTARGFVDTYRTFCDWVGEEENCFLSYGTGDVLVLLENFKRYGIPQKLSVMDYYCDIQDMCRDYLGIDKKKQPGLSAVAEAMGIEFNEMDMHRALDDSKVTARCMQKIWSQELFDRYVCKADSEFIRKLTFKPVLLCDIKNPLIEDEHFECDCPECGARMEQDSDITVKNRRFIMYYYCENCDAEYIGKHQFKLKYEGLSHKCTLRKNEPEPEEGDILEDGSIPEDCEPEDTQRGESSFQLSDDDIPAHAVSDVGEQSAE